MPTLGTMRIRKVTVNGLFGIFDHSIPFNMDERVTIIHGPNGYGKTFVLSMLDGLLRGNYALMRHVPFSSFEVEYEDGRVLGIAQTRHSRPPFQLVISEADEKHDLDSENAKHIDREFEQFAGIVSNMLPFLVRIEPFRWWSPTTGESLSLPEIIERWGDQLHEPLNNWKDMARRLTPSWLLELGNRTDVRLIQTQRLQEYPPRARVSYYWSPPDSPVVTASKYSNEIAKEVQSVLAKYAARSQELDRTFPARLLEQDKTTLSPEEITIKLNRLEADRRRFIELGILEREDGLAQTPLGAIHGKSDVLAIYVSDMQEKFKTLEELAGKVGLLTKILNERFLLKKVQIRPDKGFVFTSSIGSEISPTDLSSGEQHELILFYELLFKAKKGSLVLIDEPEISLHIAWQNKFMDDILEIVRLAEIDIVFATHSPDIIGEYWDLTVELKPPLAGISKDFQPLHCSHPRSPALS